VTGDEELLGRIEPLLWIERAQQVFRGTCGQLPSLFVDDEARRDGSFASRIASRIRSDEGVDAPPAGEPGG
jgi:hypothetical protein